jgi:hypothetical protein
MDYCGDGRTCGTPMLVHLCGVAPVHKRFDRQAFFALADDIRRRPGFAAAKARFCRDVPKSRLHQLYRHTLSADTGAFALGIAIIGMNRLYPVDGASMKFLTMPLQAAGFASPTRVRAYLDMMVHGGVIAIEPHPSDRRRRKYVPTPLYLEAQRSWYAAVLGAVSEVMPLPDAVVAAMAEPALVERFLVGVMLRHLMDGFVLMEGMPEIAAFMERRHGYLLLLELTAAEDRHVEIARARLADSYGVSPAHIAGMLAAAEGEGWLTRHSNSSEVELSPAFAELLDQWMARELAISAMWVTDKYGAVSTG